MENVRAFSPLEDYLSALEPIASTLISEYWIAPMFHHTQTLRFQGSWKMSHSQTGMARRYDPFGLRTDQNRLNGGFCVCNLVKASDVLFLLANKCDVYLRLSASHQEIARKEL